MKFKNFSSFFAILLGIILLFLTLKISNSPEKITPDDVIEIIKLKAGKTDTLLISDLFFSKSYELLFKNNSKILVKYLNNEKLILTAAQDFAGYTKLEFESDGELYSIPVKVIPAVKAEFKYKPSKPVKSVFLFGNFNNWNRSSIPMTDDNKDGIFETSYILEPGNYQYKFFVDNEELIDPANPVKIPNGLGGFNSILNVENPSPYKSFLHKKNIVQTGRTNKFLFYYENSGNLPLYDTNIVAFLDNKPIFKDAISLSGNTFEISIPIALLEGEKTLRVAVSHFNLSSNLQDIKLVNGDPANGKKSWNSSIIYSLMIDRFSDGDKSINKPVKSDSLAPKVNYFGGDFKGITKKINDGYFSNLGINTIWLSPVYDNPNEAYKEYPAPRRWFSGYHGYWPIHQEKVEEKFGTMEDLKALVAAAHKHKIKILLDFVSHHVHQDHPFFKEHKDWFGKLQLPDGRLNLRLWDEHRLTTWFEPYLPSFDFTKSKEALEAVTDNAIWWLKETGADGYRHDAVKHVPNLFWRRLTEKIKSDKYFADKKVYQIGETFGSYELIKSYVNNGQLDAQFNFELFNKAIYTFLTPEASFNDLKSEIEKSIEVFGCPNLMGNIMDSHDKDRFMAYADGALAIGDTNSTETGWKNPPVVKNPESYKLSALYYAYMMTIPGLPVIYYGSEFGMTGAADPDNRRMMRFDKELNLNEKELLSKVSQLTKIRNNHPVLSYGDIYIIQADKNNLIYLRSDFNESVLVCLTKNADQDLTIDLPKFVNFRTAKNLITGYSQNLTNNTMKIKMEKNSYSVFSLVK